MVVLAVFVIILGLGVTLALWSMREYRPRRSEGRAGVVRPKERGGEVERAKREKNSLKGEVVLRRRGEILLPPKKKAV